ncbi:glyoxalase [Marinobacterium nitratireducens]|uniref:Glyoxalase n=1 Tax=Marinobacterium nitratireducens TaxID=518897 RepID=A0A918DVN0_9GAMM|nr:VOC family protein [Marinobacterium nitratireducens]GGO86314.1 glyoxalase [Marinobacterium nitratireducens]
MTSNESGLPGLRGTDHIGFTVPNLDEAVAFFVDVIGCEAFYELGPFDSGEWLSQQLGVHPQAVMKKLKFLRCKNGSNFELFEYQAPDQNPEQPKNSDIGGHHLAFYVDDFDAALEYLKAKGVEIMGEPVVRTSGPSGGQTWVYFKTPWGMQLELLSYPNGKEYEKDYQHKLWHPAHPAE